jgi:hypothetical protein
VEFETIKLEIDGVDTVIKAIGGGPAIFALHGAATIEGHDGRAAWLIGFASICRSVPAAAKADLPGIFAGCKISSFITCGSSRRWAWIGHTSLAIPWVAGWRRKWRLSPANVLLAWC